MTEEIKAILDKMSEMAGHENVNFTDGSHLKLTWTQQQENEYVKWLCNELRTSKKTRQSLMAYPTKNKSTCLRAANTFVSIYGFARHHETNQTTHEIS